MTFTRRGQTMATVAVVCQQTPPTRMPAKLASVVPLLGGFNLSFTAASIPDGFATCLRAAPVALVHEAEACGAALLCQG